MYLSSDVIIGTFCLFCDVVFFFFQAEDGIRDAQESRGLGDVYKRQDLIKAVEAGRLDARELTAAQVRQLLALGNAHIKTCLLYTSDAADDLLCVDLGGRRIIKKKKKQQNKTKISKQYNNQLHETKVSNI